MQMHLDQLYRVICNLNFAYLFPLHMQEYGMSKQQRL